MIGKDVPNSRNTSSFRALNTYILSAGRKEKDEKLAYANCVNLAGLSTATVEMEILQHSNSRCKNPVMHTLLSWREAEQPTRKQVDEAVQITLNELGLTECQAIYALHKNTDNYHLHISINRISPITNRALTPADGWTRRAMEIAARKIEAAQGWEVEENAWTRVNEDGQIENLGARYNKKMPRAQKQKVSDMENLTGEKSATEKGKEIILPIIPTVKNWKELHEKLACEGIVYEKKGSGAVVRIGDTIVKASSLSRTCSLGTLEKKLGEFEQSEAAVNASAKEDVQKTQPTADARKHSCWQKYEQERSVYYAEKRARKKELSLKHDEIWREIKTRHKNERDELKSIPKGHWYELNALRSAVAAKQASEKAELGERLSDGRNEFYRGNPTFPSYEEWLRMQSLAKEAE